MKRGGRLAHEELKLVDDLAVALHDAAVEVHQHGTGRRRRPVEVAGAHAGETVEAAEDAGNR
jgi:hypothetical protein